MVPVVLVCSCEAHLHSALAQTSSMKWTRSSIVLALAAASAAVLFTQSTGAARVAGPSQPEPTPTPGCDPALIDPTVALAFAPSAARSGQSVTARATFRNLSAYAVELFLSMPGQRTVFHNWSGTC